MVDILTNVRYNKARKHTVSFPSKKAAVCDMVPAGFSASFPAGIPYYKGVDSSFTKGVE